MGSSKYLFKLIIAGSGGSGKTTLLTRYTTGLFKSGTKMTIGVDFNVTSCETDKGVVTLQIWDFGGEERFRTMLPSFCLGASGCIMMFDPLRPQTFHELTEWIQIVRDNTKGKIPILLVASKQDLLNEEVKMTIPIEDVENFVTKHELVEYLKVSSKMGENVTETFQSIANLMIEKNLK
ncbi:MAG: Rab family GTPase [Promethearchaeota archaeon]